MKFGGSSIANAERIDHVAHLIKDQIQSNYRPRAVICSAMGKTTNFLLSAGDIALGTYDICIWMDETMNICWICIFECRSLHSHLRCSNNCFFTCKRTFVYTNTIVEGRVNIDAIRTLHMLACDELDILYISKSIHIFMSKTHKNSVKIF